MDDGENRGSGDQSTENDGDEHNVSTTQARWVAKETVLAPSRNTWKDVL